MANNVIFNTISLSKMLLHSAKYPHFSVSGIILAAPRDSSDAELVILDVIPLFHLQLSLTPMLEIALTQIEHRYKSDGLIIAGYYQANEHLRDNVPDFVALKVGEKIAEINSDACVVMIDNRKMSLNLDSMPLTVSQLTKEGKWKNKEKAGITAEAGALDFVSQLLQRRVQHDIQDFDNHLDDITCDWSNPNINKLVRSLITSTRDD